MLRLQKVETFQPQPFTALGWDVVNINATMTQLAGKGVQFEKFPGLPQDEQGNMTFEDGAKVAWFKDPDGNLLSLTQALRFQAICGCTITITFPVACPWPK